MVLRGGGLVLDLWYGLHIHGVARTAVANADVFEAEILVLMWRGESSLLSLWWCDVMSNKLQHSDTVDGQQRSDDEKQVTSTTDSSACWASPAIPVRGHTWRLWWRG